jgi:ribokinase
MTARRLGASVDLFSAVGSDDRGTEILGRLRGAGIETSGILHEPGDTDLSVILVSEKTAERTIIWKMGRHLQRGDRIDVDRLFATDMTVVDCIDLDLRRFLTDLPAHTRPGARLLGTLTYLADVVADDKIEIALRHDVLVGNEREYCELLDCCDTEQNLHAIAKFMSGTNLRLAVMTRGEQGCVAILQNRTISVPARRIEAVDTTGAGDAFAGALAFALALRWEIEYALAFANTVGGFAVSAIGAQAGLPSLTDAIRAMDQM